MSVTESTRHLTASMVVLDLAADAVLLVHHRKMDRWVFPGGHVDPDETPGEAAVREVLEETGVRAVHAGTPMVLPGMRWHPSPWMTAEMRAPGSLATSQWPAEPPHAHIDQLFLGTGDSRAATSAQLDEVASVRWVRLDELRSLNVRDEVPVVAVLAFAHLAHIHR